MEGGAFGRRIVAPVPRDLDQGVFVLQGAVGFEAVGFGVVLNFVGVYLPVALGHLDVAFEGGIAVDANGGVVAVNVNFAVRRAGLFFLQGGLLGLAVLRGRLRRRRSGRI